LPQHTQAVMEPRKTPVQARSTASVDAILQATIQVLLKVGKDKLTTTLVAHRAGVSVGTLYQYFPNKSALLKSALTRHLDEVTGRVEAICLEQRGRSLDEMASGLLTAFLQTKMKDSKTSVALYAVSSDVDAAKIVKEKGARSTKAIVAMLQSSPETLNDPKMAAEMLQGLMVGTSRRLLESPSPEKQFAPTLAEMIFLSRAYLSACVMRG